MIPPIQPQPGAATHALQEVKFEHGISSFHFGFALFPDLFKFGVAHCILGGGLDGLEKSWMELDGLRF